MEKTNSKHESIFVCRFVLTTVSLIFIVMAVIQFIIALKIELPQALTRKMMWIGSLLWVIMIITGFIQNLKKKKEEFALSFLLFLMIIAIPTVAGMFIPTFVNFTLWANAVLFILFAIAIVSAFPQTWKKGCVAKNTNTSQ